MRRRSNNLAEGSFGISPIPARLHLGDLLAGLGRAEDALDEYRTVLTIDPDHPVALENVIALSGVRERVADEVEYRTTHDRPPGLRDTYRAPRKG